MKILICPYFPLLSYLPVAMCKGHYARVLLSGLMCVFYSSYLKQIKEELIPGVANCQLGLEVTNDLIYSVIISLPVMIEEMIMCVYFS